MVLAAVVIDTMEGNLQPDSLAWLVLSRDDSRLLHHN
jgi:hypothetical protein